MSDKDFKVKNKLIVSGLNNASGVIIATNKELDSHSLLPTQYGGTGTTTSPTSGQILYSPSGSTYTPTNVDALFPSQTGNTGKYLTTNGSSLSWGAFDGVSEDDLIDLELGINLFE